MPTILLLYLLGHVANLLLTRLATGSVQVYGPGATPANLVILPWSLAIFAVLTCLFIYVSGWHRDARGRTVAGLHVPWPTVDTALSGVGSAMMLTSIPLLFSLREMSIPLILLLMRGGALCMAPIVDIAFRRPIRWPSAVALAMVAAALLIALLGRGGSLGFTPLALTAVVLYNLGYLVRIAVMTHVAKRGDVVQTRQYFVEEKVVAMPVALVALACIVAVGPGANPAGFAGVLFVDWTLPLAAAVFGVGATLTFVSVLAAVILLGAQENSYCVPLERAGGLLSGFIAAWLIHWGWDQPPPTAEELLGAAMLLAAMLLLLIFMPRDKEAGAVFQGMGRRERAPVASPENLN